MTKLELLKYVSELEVDMCCSRPSGHDCRTMCPESVYTACLDRNKPLRKVLALNEYELLLSAEKRKETRSPIEEMITATIEREPKPEKVWRFKTIEECGGKLPPSFIECMRYLVGITLPESAIASTEAGNFCALRGEDWRFSQDSITFDYPIE